MKVVIQINVSLGLRHTLYCNNAGLILTSQKIYVIQLLQSIDNLKVLYLT